MSTVYNRPASASEIDDLTQITEEYFVDPEIKQRSSHPLSGGPPAPVFFNMDRALESPHRAETICRLYEAQIAKLLEGNAAIDFLAFIDKGHHHGTTIGAIMLASQISTNTRIPLVTVRLQKDVLEYRVNAGAAESSARQKLAGKKGVIVTDHVTFGSEVLEAIETIEACSGKVRAVVTYTLAGDLPKDQAETRQSRFEGHGVTLLAAHVVAQFEEDSSTLQHA